MSRQQFVTVDLDSTLADTSHRQHLVDGLTTDWSEFSLACVDDTLIESTARIVRHLAETCSILIVSGRSAVAYRETESWLWNNKVPYDGLFLADLDEPFTSHEAYKVKAVTRVAHLHPKWEHLFHLDDWPPVAPALQAAGFRCLLVPSPVRVFAS